jgi:hypothetical protein
MKIGHTATLLYNSNLRLLLYQARAGNDTALLRRGIELANQILDGEAVNILINAAILAVVLLFQWPAA